MNHHPVLAIAGIFLAALLVACSGGGDSKPKLQFDPAKANDLAHAALIDPTDLPGTGWTVSENDKFNDNTTAPANTDACNRILAFQKDNKAIDDKARTARAQREFQRTPQGSPLPISLDMEIAIYSDPSSLDSRLQKVKELDAAGTYLACYGDGLKASLPNAGTINTRLGDALAKSPNNGFAISVEADVAGLPAPLVQEFYGWIHGNATVTLTVVGLKSALAAEPVLAAIQKTEAALNEAK